jgi:hypothetical protein
VSNRSVDCDISLSVLVYTSVSPPVPSAVEGSLGAMQWKNEVYAATSLANKQMSTGKHQLRLRFYSISLNEVDDSNLRSHAFYRNLANTRNKEFSFSNGILYYLLECDLIHSYSVVAAGSELRRWFRTSSQMS